MARQTSQLIVSLIDRVTGPAKQAAGGIQALQTRIVAAQAANSRAMSAMHGSLLGAGAVGYALARSLSSPVKAAMEFESAMADVRKVVDFDTPKEFGEFGDQILKMSTAVPIAAKGLSEIAAAAGQAGIAKKDILGFTEMAAQVGVAFDISAKDAGEAMAKLKTGLNLTIPQTRLLADAMNHLSNNMASSAPGILDVVRRVGAQAKTFGFNEIQVSAFASAMLAAGAESEVAATSFRNMGNALTKGGSATKSQRKAFAALRLDAKKVAIAMQKDAVGTTLMVMERLAAMPAHLRASLSSDLFGNEARALGPLLTNLPLLKESLGYVGDESKYAGSALKEYEVRSKTFANAVQLFEARLHLLKIRLGEALIPAINDMMKAFSPFIDGIAEFIKAHPKLTRGIIGTASALIGMRIAGIAAKFAFLMMKGAALGLAAPLLKVASGIRAVAAASLLMASRGGLAAAGAAMMALLKPINILRGALKLLRGALLLSGVGAVLIGIGAAGKFIADNWQGIGVFFDQFGTSLSNALSAENKARLQPFLDIIGEIARIIKDPSFKIDDATWKRWGDEAGKAAGGGLNDLAEALKNISYYLDKIAQVVGAPAAIGRWLGDKGRELVGLPPNMRDADGKILNPRGWDGKEISPMGSMLGLRARRPSSLVPAFAMPGVPMPVSRPAGIGNARNGLPFTGPAAPIRPRVDASEIEGAARSAREAKNIFGTLSEPIGIHVDASSIRGAIGLVDILNEKLGQAKGAIGQLRAGGEVRRTMRGLQADTGN